MIPGNFIFFLKNAPHVRWQLLLIGLALAISILSGMIVRFLPAEYLLFLVGGVVFIYLLLFKIEAAIIVALFVQNQLARFNYMGQGTPYHPNGLMGLMLIAGAVIYFLYNRVDVSRFRAIGGFLGFMVVSVLSLFFTRAYFKEGLGVLLRLVAALAIYAVLVYKLDSIKKIKWVIAAVIAAQVLPTINSLSLYGGTTGLLFTDETMRLGNSGVGVYLSEITTLCLIFWMDSKKPASKIIFGALTALFGAGLFFSFGRSGWIGFVFGLILLGLLRRRWLLFFLPVVLILVIFFVPGVSQRFSDVLSASQPGSGTNTFLGRVGFWQVAIDVYKNHLLGVGFGKGAYFLGASRGATAYMVHNDYISVLLETGMVGLLLFLIWQVQWGHVLFKNYQSANGDFDKTFSLAVFIIFAASLLMRVTDNIVLDSYDMYPLCALIASTLAIPRIRRAQASESTILPSGQSLV